jgi:HK97 family phage portal protein
MSILDNIRNYFTGEEEPEKKMTGSMAQYLGVGPTHKSYKYQDLAKEGYLKNAIVFRCVNEISSGASAVNFKIFNGDEELEMHPLINLLNRPNPLQSNFEFMKALSSYLLLSGNSYILKSGSENGPPKELHLLRPDRMRIKSGGKPIPEKYEYMIEGKVHATYPVDPITGKAEVKHIKLYSPLDDLYGCSPLSAAAVEVDQHNLSSQHNISLLSNGARPSGAIVFKPVDDSGFSVNLTESQRAQLLTDMNKRFTGTNNAGRPLLLEGDFNFIEMGLSPKDMDFLNLKNLATTDIALCFGVPSQLVGVPDAQTYANVAEARLALYEETIIPHLKQIESDLNEWLVPMYDERLTLKYDIDAIPALAERKRKIYENITSAVREGIMTRNEARSEIGLEAIKGADELFISATLFPLGDGDVEEPENPISREEVEGYEEEAEEEQEADKFLSVLDDYFCVEKALSDLDFTPTDGMKAEAQRGLDWRKEYGRGGTQVGMARANQLIRKEKLSPDTVRRMYSFFSRHEVDKQAEGFSPGEDGYPSNGRIAWALWGGDAGFSWSTKKWEQIQRETRSIEFEENHVEAQEDTKALSAAVRKGLQKKVDDHNEKYGDNPKKRATLRMLEAVFRRGVGAYRTNPSSVRPSVVAAGGEDRWAYARVNAFLYALRNERFRGGKFDTDLFPKGHPLSSKT